MAGSDTFYLIVQHGLLKRDHRIAQKFGIVGKKTLGRTKIPKHKSTSFF